MGPMRSKPAAVGGLPRPVDFLVAAVGLALASPVIAACALAVAATSRGPVFFRQERVGRGGRPFTFFKLRTMRRDAGGPGITAGGDPRVTAVGRLLRRAKLDELPSLWNVVRGDLALVGPRPELPRYVDLGHPDWQEVLAVRPGLTDPVTLALRDEEALLAAAPGGPEEFYRRHLLPFKLAGYRRYLERRSWRSDLGVLARSAWAVLRPASAAAPTREEIAAAHEAR
jgi:lipopolysaccharide/colanic/teichoic acid biosynthesis glycosyltransferase